jgi:hypothetical protein
MERCLVERMVLLLPFSFSSLIFGSALSATFMTATMRYYCTVPYSAKKDVDTVTMLKDVRCWLMLYSLFCTLGGGLFVSTNASQMLSAVGGREVIL